MSGNRGTEPLDWLHEKLRRYRIAEYRLQYERPGARSVLFVVPGRRRLQHLRELTGRLEGTATGRYSPRPPASLARQRNARADLAPTRPRSTSLLAACAPRPARAPDFDLSLAFGRRWRHEQPGFWERLSPLGRTHRARSRSTCARPRGMASWTRPALRGPLMAMHLHTNLRR